MVTVEIVEKKGPMDLTLRITSSSLEEREFLQLLYNRRVVPSKLIINADDTVTIEYSY